MSEYSVTYAGGGAENEQEEIKKITACPRFGKNLLAARQNPYEPFKCPGCQVQLVWWSHTRRLILKGHCTRKSTQ